VRVLATYACPRAPRRLHLRFRFLDRLPADHRHLAAVHLEDGRVVQELALVARPEVDVDVAPGAGESSSGFGSLLRAGVGHILTGADHLAFLLALVLGGTLLGRGPGGGAGSRTDLAALRARAGALVAMLTAFTVGHSASLALATLAGFAPGARWVEPAVALSVAYVGAENLWARGFRHRWLLTLPFGFVHGFAFAGGLLPLGLPRERLPAALFAFNLGVELGQLGVLAVMLPVPLLLRVFAPRIGRGVAVVLSVMIVAAGAVWFVQRVW
jgi:hypothetical protein